MVAMSSILTAPGMLIAKVRHKRLRPRVHGFGYKVYYLCFPLSQMQKLGNALLSLETFNLLSFYKRDHGLRDGNDLETWARGILAQYHVTAADGEIVLLTLPRVLGYVFNPVSFWFCLDKAGGLRAVISEVNNTYGEHHSYISYHDDQRVIAPADWIKAEKVFYVSPFLDVVGHYQFRFAYTNNAITVHVNHFDEQGMMLATSLTGPVEPLTLRRSMACFLAYPLVTLKVIALIHYEAVRLLLKGIRRRQKPIPPTYEVTR